MAILHRFYWTSVNSTDLVGGNRVQLFFLFFFGGGGGGEGVTSDSILFNDDPING